MQVFNPHEVAHFCIKDMGLDDALRYCVNISRDPTRPLSREYQAAAEIIRKRIEAPEHIDSPVGAA